MKKLTHILNRIAPLIIGFSILLTACSDFLDVPIEGELPIDYNKEPTPEEAFMYVSSCYAGLRKFGVHVFPYIGMYEITSDDADKGSTPDDSPAMIAMETFSYTPDNDLIGIFWDDHYAVISNCNYAINTLLGLNFSDSLLRNSMIAETRFLRAFMYFRLNQTFGGVPLIDTTLTAEEFAKIPRSSSEKIFDFIEDDLEYAITNLELSVGNSEAGRATQGAARALLARVYMFQNEWQPVYDLTQEVIKTGLYDLYPDFYRLFRVQAENSIESVFELQLTSLDQGKYKCEYGFVQGPRNNFSKLQGWGFCVPSQGLIDFFDSRNDSIRKFATVMPRGTSTPEGDSINEKCPNPYYNRKVYTAKKYNTIDYGIDHNIRLIRYADVLLMNAEAAWHIGADAATPLNKVRARVVLEPINAPTLNDIWDERRAEFALEEIRFFDLVRTGQAATVLAAKGFKTGVNEVFPLPQKQIDLSNGVLEQNNGY